MRAWKHYVDWTAFSLIVLLTVFIGLLIVEMSRDSEPAICDQLQAKAATRERELVCKAVRGVSMPVFEVLAINQICGDEL